jgi:hypothetical protein
VNEPVIDLNELSNELVNAFVVNDCERDLSKVDILFNVDDMVKVPVIDLIDVKILDID